MHYDIWRMEAMNELREHNARRQALKNIPSKIAELEAAMTAIRSGTSDGTPVSGGGSGRENALLNNIVERQNLHRSLKETREAVKRVEDALAVLPAEDRNILEKCYMNYDRGAIARLAAEFGVEEKTIRNRRNDALHLFKKAMYGEIF